MLALMQARWLAAGAIISLAGHLTLARGGGDPANIFFAWLFKVYIILSPGQG
jgi:hypothetical protein